MAQPAFDNQQPVSANNPKELVAERTENNKVYDIGNGQRRLVCRSNPQHYRDGNGDFQDVDYDITNNRVNKCAYDMTLYTDKIGYYGTDPNGKNIELELTGVAYKSPSISGNKAIWTEIEPNVDFEIEFNAVGIRVTRILKSALANKTAVYRSYRESGAVGEIINLAIDNDGSNAKITNTIEDGAKTDEKLITQTFDDQVMKINETTRVREWSSDVTYPVKVN